MRTAPTQTNGLHCGTGTFEEPLVPLKKAFSRFKRSSATGRHLDGGMTGEASVTSVSGRGRRSTLNSVWQSSQ